MKKIYIFNSDSRAAVYGIGTYLEQLVAVCLKMPDVVLSVVKLYSDKEEVTCERKDGYDLLSIPMDFGNEEKMKDRYFFHALYVLLANFQIDEDENVIFHFNYNIPLNLILFVKNTIPNSKIVYTIHYQTWAFSLNGNLKRFRSIINSEGALPGTRESNIKEQFYKEKDFYAAIDKIICISRFTKSLLMHDFGIEESRIALIYNGLKDDGGNVSMQSKERIKKKIGVIPGEKVILFVGRLDSIKGLSYLINAFKLVLNKDSHVHLYILGDGDFSDYLALIKEYWNKVTFTGRLNKDELYEFYQIADIGVMPSLHEQCSYVAMEMLMFNIPLLISTSTGLNETLEGVEKIEVEEREDDVYISVEKMAESMLALLQAPPSNMYRETYLRKYEESLFLEKMRNLYESLFV